MRVCSSARDAARPTKSSATMRAGNFPTFLVQGHAGITRPHIFQQAINENVEENWIAVRHVVSYAFSRSLKKKKVCAACIADWRRSQHAARRRRRRRVRRALRQSAAEAAAAAGVGRRCCGVGTFIGMHLLYSRTRRASGEKGGEQWEAAGRSLRDRLGSRPLWLHARMEAASHVFQRFCQWSVRVFVKRKRNILSANTQNMEADSSQSCRGRVNGRCVCL